MKKPEITSQINRLVMEVFADSDMDHLYELMKARVTTLDRMSARNFHLDQEVEFSTRKDGPMRGKIESIGRTGRVKVKLVNSRYDSYTLGANCLFENLKR